MTDNILKYPTQAVLQQVPGALRWHNGTLQQEWHCAQEMLHNGASKMWTEWRDVPHVMDVSLPPPPETE